MYIDVVRYLQQMPETSWNTGNESRYAFKDGYFFKCLKSKAPEQVHNFFVSNRIQTAIGSLTPRFEMYYYLTDDDLRSVKNTTHRHIYVFEKSSFVELKLYFEKQSCKDVMYILDDLEHFFHELDQEYIAYQDACWENIGVNKMTNKLCVIDMDSMVETHNSYDKIKNLGSPLFHTSFLKFKKRYARSQYEMLNLKHLNLCTYHNILFAFVLGLSRNDTRYSLMKAKSVVNTLVTKYVDGDYTSQIDDGQLARSALIDEDSVKVLKSATKIVSMCIEGKYSGDNPFADMALLARELIGKFPSVRAPANIPATPMSGSVYNKHIPSVRADSSSTKPDYSRTVTVTQITPPKTQYTQATSSYTPTTPIRNNRSNFNPMRMVAQVMFIFTIFMLFVNLFAPSPNAIAVNNTSDVPVIVNTTGNMTDNGNTTSSVYDFVANNTNNTTIIAQH